MIRFFVSSTFQDMREERECLRSNVWPKVHEYARKKGIYVEFCDLRWGININDNLTEEEAMAKIAEICLQEVENCKPYLITMLGDYYGSIPKKPQQIQKAWTQISGMNYDGDTKISLTHWELEFAFLHDKNPEIKALCGFKDKGNLCAKMNQLKENIRAISDNINAKDKTRFIKITDYKDEADFAEFLKIEIEKIIDQEAKQKAEKNWVEHEFDQAKAYVEEKTREFAGRTESQLKFQTFLKSKKNFFGISGKSGIGKSSLLSHLYGDVERELNKCFIACGINSRSLTYRDVLLQINYFIDWCIDNNSAEINECVISNFELEDEIQSSIEEYNKKRGNKTILIFIDAVDKLSMVEGDGFAFLLKLNEGSKVKFIISQIDSFKIKSDNPRTQELELKELMENEQFDILQRGIFPANDRDFVVGMNRELLNLILSKKGVGSPLYLRTVIMILKMHMQGKNGHEPSRAELESRVAKMPESVMEICQYAFEEADEYIGYNLCEKVIGLIAFSINGLREAELEQLLGSEGWDQLDFIRFRQYLNDFFRMQSDGRWTFEHDLIKQSVCRMIKDNQVFKRKLITLLNEYIAKTDDDSDIIRYETALREGFHLSMIMAVNGDKEGYRIANKLCGLCSKVEPDMQLRGTIARTIDNLLQNGDNFLSAEQVEEWYETLVMNHSSVLIDMLNCLIELERDEEYERRLPAMRLVERFLNIKGLKEETDIQEYLDSIKSGSDQFKFCSLCAEYSSALESIDKPMKAITYISVALKYFLDYMESDLPASDIEDEKLRKKVKVAFTHLNSMLYTNNKIMNLAKQTMNHAKKVMNHAKARSEQIIAAYQGKDTFRVKMLEQYFLEESDQEVIERVDKLYNSNMGQFYNALEKYEIAFSFHIMSVKWKIEMFMKKLPSSISLSKWGDLSFNNAIKSWAVNPHVEFWGNMKEQLENYLTVDKDSDELLTDWKLVATGYTTLGSDLYHFSNQLEDFKDIEQAIRNSLGAWKIANNMVNWTQLSGMEREQMQYGSRFLGSYLNLLKLPNCELTDEEVHELKSIVQKLTDLYDRRRELFSLETKIDLEEKMNSLLDTKAIDKELPLYQDIKTCIHRLNNI